MLPCPELQCTGESNCPPLSPGSKQAAHGGEGKPTFMHVDCFQERSADGLVVVSTARSKSVLEVNNTTPLSVSNQLNGKSGTDYGLQVMGAVKRSRVEQSDGTHDAESPQILGCCLQLERDQILNRDPELKASFPRAESCQIEECNILNDRCHERNPFNTRVSLEEESDPLRNREFQHLVGSIHCKEENVVERLNKVNDNFMSEAGAQRNQNKENKRVTNELFHADSTVVGSSGLPQNNGSSNLHGLYHHAPTFSSEPSNLSLGDKVMEETAIEGQSTEPEGPEALWVKVCLYFSIFHKHFFDSGFEVANMPSYSEYSCA